MTIESAASWTYDEYFEAYKQMTMFNGPDDELEAMQAELASVGDPTQLPGYEDRLARRRTNAQAPIPTDTGVPAANAAGGLRTGKPITLPDTFYLGSPVLEHIRTAAWARLCSPTAVVAATLTLVAARMHPRLQLPPLIGGEVSGNQFMVLVAGVGGGKSSPVRCAQRLMDDYEPDTYFEHEGGGTGEGVIEAHFEVVDKKKTQTKNGLFWFMDEGSSLGNELNRVGSNLSQVMCTAWMGGGVGQLNAKAERRRSLPSHSYSWGLLVIIQEKIVDRLISESAIGLTQRMVWAYSQDPDAPDIEPQWPGSLGWLPPKFPDDVPSGLSAPLGASGADPVGVVKRATVQAEMPGWFRQKIRDDHKAVLRGTRMVARMEEHQNLKWAKLALRIANLHGRLHINDDDLRRAAIFLDEVDRPTRVRMESTLEMRTEEEHITAAKTRLQARTADADVWENKIIEIAKRKLKDTGTDMTWGALSPSLRKYINDRRLSKEDAIEILTEAAIRGEIEIVGHTPEGHHIYHAV